MSSQLVRMLPLVGLLACSPGPLPDAGPDTEWPSYGNDAGGARFVPLEQISRDNVDRLEVAWEVHTGDVAGSRPPFKTTSAFQLTPILVDGTLYACTPFNRVLALDPQTGAERWSFDPEIDLHEAYANQLACRGVSHWRDPSGVAGTPCARRIFTATADARLIALDAASGRRCEDFGARGSVGLADGIGDRRWPGEYQLTSPPAIAADLVIVGGAVADGRRVDAPSGVVRAFDARTGALRWAWNPELPGVPGGRAPETGYRLSSPNVWAPMSVDEERDLLFLPTGNPTPDYANAQRRGLDTFGSSLVVLRASTGERVWHFQTVHNDLWDFDVPAQPTLFSLEREGRRIPAVVQATKMGMLFTFDRESGEPLFPIEERPVPQGAESGLVLSPTQPFPLLPPPLVRHQLNTDDAFGFTPWDRGVCRSLMESLRWEGIYTPPSRQGTLMLPGNGGGSNWGGVAVDPERQLLVANVMDLAWQVTLIPPEELDRARAERPDAEHAPQEGTAWAMRREILDSPLGIPCNPPPWGILHAVDLRSGELLWSSRLGTVRDLSPIPLPWKAGTPNIGGPLVTRSGLIFIGATMDDYLRAFDVETGEEVWKGRLPAGGQATPMSYAAGGRQYVVIAAGGHGRAGTRPGDSILAFALPR